MSEIKKMSERDVSGVCLRTCPKCGSYACCNWMQNDVSQYQWKCSRCNASFVTYKNKITK